MGTRTLVAGRKTPFMYLLLLLHLHRVVRGKRQAESPKNKQNITEESAQPVSHVTPRPQKDHAGRSSGITCGLLRLCTCDLHNIRLILRRLRSLRGFPMTDRPPQMGPIYRPRIFCHYALVRLTLCSLRTASRLRNSKKSSFTKPGLPKSKHLICSKLTCRTIACTVA